MSLCTALPELTCSFFFLHFLFFFFFWGRHSQSHSFRWTNMTRHQRGKSQLKINTSSNTLFTFPVSLFIPKYPVGAGARWLTRTLFKFSHAYLGAAYGDLTLYGLEGGYWHEPPASPVCGRHIVWLSGRVKSFGAFQHCGY